jgi:hypothetical protein
VFWQAALHRLFLWFSLRLPAAAVDALGDISRAADTNSFWLLLIGVWLLLWAGYTGAKALQLIHALVWNEPPPRTRPLKSSLAFNATCLSFMAVVGLTWWIRDETELVQLLTAAVMVVPLAALWLWVSMLLPHGRATWRRLLPGAIFTAIGFQVLHGCVVFFLSDELERRPVHGVRLSRRCFSCTRRSDRHRNCVEQPPHEELLRMPGTDGPDKPPHVRGQDDSSPQSLAQSPDRRAQPRGPWGRLQEDRNEDQPERPGCTPRADRASLRREGAAERPGKRR